MKQKIYNWLKENPKTKRYVLNIMIHPVRIRPRWWLRLFIPLYADMARGSVMYRSVRKDIAPFNKFCVGKCSVIEDYSIVNNLVGDIIVGNYSRVGFGNVIIGPVTIGSHVSLAQNITVTGLDHNYQDVNLRIDEQGVSTSMVLIEDDVWVGANSVITRGVTIGKHSVVAGGSLVNRDVPPFSIVAGNPAKVIKIYNPVTQVWEKAVPAD